MDVSPRARRNGAAFVVLLSVVGWPVSALTFASTEPATVLGLSWAAITLTALDIWATTDVRVEQDDDDRP